MSYEQIKEAVFFAKEDPDKLATIIYGVINSSNEEGETPNTDGGGEQGQSNPT